MAETLQKLLYWTAEEDQVLRDMTARGKTCAEIGNCIGKSSDAVSHRRRILNVRRKRDLLEWTSELIDEMRALWDQNWSGLKIAQHLSDKYERTISRCAIIGKINRLGLGRPNTAARSRPQQTGRKRGPYARTRQKEQLKLIWSAPPEPTGPGINFLELQANNCRYINGSPNGTETIFCGEPTKYRSFCSYHASICFGRDERRLPRSLPSAAPVTSPSPDDPAGAALPFPGAA